MMSRWYRANYRRHRWRRRGPCQIRRAFHSFHSMRLRSHPYMCMFRICLNCRCQRWPCHLTYRFLCCQRPRSCRCQSRRHKLYSAGPCRHCHGSPSHSCRREGARSRQATPLALAASTAVLSNTRYGLWRLARTRTLGAPLLPLTKRIGTMRSTVCKTRALARHWHRSCTWMRRVRVGRHICSRSRRSSRGSLG